MKITNSYTDKDGHVRKVWVNPTSRFCGITITVQILTHKFKMAAVGGHLKNLTTSQKLFEHFDESQRTCIQNLGKICQVVSEEKQ